MKKIFVSYSRDDKEIVQATVSELRSFNFDVWIDTDGIKPGERFSVEISQAIADCNFFILFISHNSMRSDFIQREIDVAHKKEKKIIPILLEDVEIPIELDLQLAGIQWIEYKDTKWFNWLLVALGSENHKDVKPQQQTLEAAISEDTNGTRVEKVELDFIKVIDIFNRNFVNPKECDETSTILRCWADTIAENPNYMFYQFSLSPKFIGLADQIDEFRKICRSGSSVADSDRRKILKDLLELQTEVRLKMKL